MKELDILYSSHPEDSKHYTTEQLRKHYLIENVFVEDDISLTYSHQNRIIDGDALRADYFLQRRELGIINIANDGIVTLDGVKYESTKTYSLYVGMDTKEVLFESKDKTHPAKFYMCSAPAHRSCPPVFISIAKANKVHLGDQEHINARTIVVKNEEAELFIKVRI